MSLSGLWPLLVRPYDPGYLAEAALGMPVTTARRLAAALHASSPEADRLLAALPELSRSFGVRTINRPERVVGEVRGPILWGETMSAMATSGGDRNVVVCATPKRDYDTPENRVLASALRSIAAAGDLVALGQSQLGSALTRKARRNGVIARRALEHRALTGLHERPANRKERRKVAQNPRRRAYLPALAVLDRGDEPLSPADLIFFETDVSTAGHGLFLRVLNVARSRGSTVPPIRPEHGALVAGPVRYIHPKSRAAELHDSGVYVGTVLLDPSSPVPEDRVLSALDAVGLLARPENIVKETLSS